MAQTIGFIGLGNMGGPMAANLVKAGHAVRGFDLVPASLEAARAEGIAVAGSALEAAEGADVVVTMLPAGRHVVEVWTQLAEARARRHAADRFLHGGRRERPQGPRPRRGARLPVGGRAGLRRDRRREGRNAHVHGRRRRGRLRQGGAAR